MKVGVLKDIKVGEYRVIATPAEVSMLVGDGNEVYVQKGAGEGSGFPDEAYVKRARSWLIQRKKFMQPAISSQR